ncbi:MAG: EamA-like transporter family protein [Bacteroidetes bacterium ADurb.Bin408]|nr:MAG: EamA-like transporter family protein [Bacteroidetes bacterium ADurb.Bin408]
MFSSYQGEWAALLTVIFWTTTALVFESASLKVGSIAVNFLRLFLALVILSIYNYLARGMAFPIDATPDAWFWLVLSGIIGLVLGDYFLFEAFTLVGSRISMLVMTLVPPLTALIGWFALGEHLTLMHFLGMGLTMSGVALVVLYRGNGQQKLKMNYPPKGILYAFLGAVGQAVGLIFSKLGMKDYNPFAATQIRVITSVIGFAIVVTVWKKWGKISAAIRQTVPMLKITTGAFFGPFLGISFSLYAIQHTKAGIASTIMAMVPVLIIPPAVFIMKQKVTTKEIIGAIISVLGILIFFL